MPRPRLGQAAKSTAATVRITESERIALTRQFGSPAKGLRVLLDHWKTPTKKEETDG